MKKTILYLDCSAGLSGDMAAGALLDLTEDQDAVLSAVSALFDDKRCAAFETVWRSDRLCRRFFVSGNREAHVHRTFGDIRRLIMNVPVSSGAKDLALSVYRIIAQAEAEVHETTMEQVKFHEVGSLSSLADVLVFSACYCELGIQQSVIPCLYDGKGTVACAHGELAVPVPAVRAILRQNAVPFHQLEVQGEILTPTGAAIAAAIRSDLLTTEGLKDIKTGYGAGTRETGLRGYAAAVLMEPTEEIK